MASDNVKVSQNFSEISRVLQSCFFSKAILESINLDLTIQGPQKVSVPQRKRLVSLSCKGSYLPFATPWCNSRKSFSLGPKKCLQVRWIKLIVSKEIYLKLSLAHRACEGLSPLAAQQYSVALGYQTSTSLYAVDTSMLQTLCHSVFTNAC